MPKPSQIAFITGLAGTFTVIALTVIGGAAFPGYSHASQYISELGARGAPLGGWVTFAGFLPAGVLLVTFAIAATRALPRSRWTLLAMIGVGLYGFGYLNSVPFRCDFGCRPEQPSLSQQLHNLGGLIGYLGGALGLLIIALQARRWPDARLPATVAAVGGVVSLVALAGLDPNFAYAGLAQRLIEASMLGWISVTALYLRGHPQLRAQST